MRIDDTVHVLVMEEDQRTREEVRLILEAAGYDVSEAPDTRLGLETLRNSPFRLVVLMSYVMPEMSGLTLLGAVMSNAHQPMRHAYIVMTSSPKRVAHMSGHLLARLSIPILAKPISAERLVPVVARVAHRVQVPQPVTAG